MFPKELLDIIFNYSDIKTKRILKKLCKLTYASYNFICCDPIVNPYIIKCQVKYNNKMVESFIHKKGGYTSNKQTIFWAYNKIVEKYNLDKANIVNFNIIWGNKCMKYSVQNNELLFKNLPSENLTTTDVDTNVIDDGRFRKFTLIHNRKHIGTFLGRMPLQAAAKAFERLVKINRKENIDGNYSTDFTIQEITKSSSYKFYYYTGTSRKLVQPTIVHLRGGGQITYKAINNIKKRAPKYKIVIKN